MKMQRRQFIKGAVGISAMATLAFQATEAGTEENLEQMIEQTRALREKFLRDRHRPLYHFVSPEGVCHPFDPNGSIFWKGQYHLMYIFQDHKGHNWGHAVSKDMLHWRILPPALEPGDGDKGIFSGAAFVNKEGKPTIIYYGVKAGGCIAVARDDELIEWEKLSANPIVPMLRKGHSDYGKYRACDPHGWLEGDTYYAIFGGDPSGMMASVFKARELDQWHYVGDLLANTVPGVDLREDIFCPDMFRLGDKDVLVCISHRLGCRYYIGKWKNEQFHPESHGLMNWPGGRFFANDSFLDDRGRRILLAWVGEAMLAPRLRKNGWAGVMSMPKILTLAADNTLRINPIREIELLRITPRVHRDLRLADGADVVLKDIAGDCMEIDLKIDPGSASRVGLRVRRSPQGREETIIACEPAAGKLMLDVTRSSLDKDVRYGTHRPHTAEGGDDVRVQKAPFEVTPSDTFKLRVFLDRSIIEVYGDDRQCVTQRIYPSRKDALSVSLFCKGGSAKVLSLNAWDMAATNPW